MRERTGRKAGERVTQGREMEGKRQEKKGRAKDREGILRDEVEGERES